MIVLSYSLIASVPDVYVWCEENVNTAPAVAAGNATTGVSKFERAVATATYPEDDEEDDQESRLRAYMEQLQHTRRVVLAAYVPPHTFETFLLLIWIAFVQFARERRVRRPPLRVPYTGMRARVWGESDQNTRTRVPQESAEEEQRRQLPSARLSLRYNEGR